MQTICMFVNPFQDLMQALLPPFQALFHRLPEALAW